MDWDNDGRKDLVTGDWAGYVRVYLNTASDDNPTFGDVGYVCFGEVPFVVAGAYGLGFSTPEVVDWNNDGKKDLLCGGYAGKVQLLLNTAPTPADMPSFSAGICIQDGGTDILTGTGSRSTVVAVDWNCDGRKDLLVGDGFYIRFYENRGTDSSPVFNGYRFVKTGAANVECQSVGFEVADWNNDSVTDLLVGSASGSVKCYLGIAPIRINIATNVNETAGVITGNVSVTVISLSDLLVSLSTSNSNPGEVTLPLAVTIPAGQTGAQFTATINDDPYLDGTQVAIITASAAGYAPDVAQIYVTDSEMASLSVSLPASSVEGMGVLVNQGRVTVIAAVYRSTEVQLRSTDTSEIIVPETVTIPPGQTGALFNITVVDDSQIDWVQTADVIAHVANWAEGSASMSVADNESMNLSVGIPAWCGEGDGTVAWGGWVGISGTLADDLAVSLVSCDTSELLVPDTVIIPAGQINVYFDPTVLDDGWADGQQVVLVTATAVGFTAGTGSTVVADHEVARLDFVPVPSPQVANVPFAVGVRAVDITGSNAAYLETVSFSAAGHGGPLPVTPSVSGNFTNGAWGGSLSVNGLGSNVRLVATSGTGYSATSAPFTVVNGPVNRFVWDTVTSPQTVTVPFSAKITALDANGYPAADFAGPVDIEGFSLDACKAIGSGSIPWSFPLYTYYHDARTQVICPAADLACTGVITSLALDVTGLPGQPMNHWTIRMKHTTLNSYPEDPQWEGAGWTVVYQGNDVISSIGWATFVFSTPFLFNGTNSLMIDFSFNNSSYTVSGGVRSTDSGATRSIVGYADSWAGDPLDWPGSYPANAYSDSLVPNIRLGLGTRVAVDPGVSGMFENGSWTGQLCVAQTGTAVRIWAHDGGDHGNCTEPFDVLDLPLAITGISALGSNGLRVGFGSVSGRYYTAQWKTNLLDPDWMALPSFSNVFSAGGVVDIVHTNLFNAAFYRIRQEP